MEIFEAIKHRTPAGRFALPASLIVAIWGLLAFATPASADIGEAVDGAPAAVAAVAETPAAVVEGEGVQTAPVAPAPEPVEVEAAQEVPSAAEPADVAPASDPVGPQGSPPAPESIDSPSPSPQVAAAGRGMSKLVRSVGKGSAESIAPSTDRLQVVRISPRSSLERVDDSLRQVAEPLFQAPELVQSQVTALAQNPLGSLGFAAVEALLSPIGPWLETATGPSADGPFGFPAPPRPGSLFPHPAIGGSTLQRLPEPGEPEEAVAAGSGASDSPDGHGPAMQPAVAGDPDAILADTATGHSQSPAPLDVPLPAPGSPGAIAPGSGSPIFVPLAALLALLALVAPAILRRLGEVPGFRPPTPFACALERPG